MCWQVGVTHRVGPELAPGSCAFVGLAVQAERGLVWGRQDRDNPKLERPVALSAHFRLGSKPQARPLLESNWAGSVRVREERLLQGMR